MRIVGLLVALTLALCACAPAWAQEPEDDDDDRCLDSRGHDRCADQIAWVFAQDYGLPAAEGLAGKPDLVLRISEYAFNTLEPALVFTVAPDGNGSVDVFPPRRSAAPAFGLPLSPAETRDVVRLAELTASLPIYEPEPPPAKGEELVICGAEASVDIEAVRGGTVVRRSSNPCSKDDAFDQADALARAVVGRLALCQPFANSRGSRPFATLHICSILDGDRAAAAEVLQRAFEFGGGGRARDSRPLDAYLAPDASLTGPDARHVGVAAVTAAWRALEPTFDWIRATGEPGGRATIEGRVFTETYAPREGGQLSFVESRRAPFTQRWRKHAGAWRLERICLGAWVIDTRWNDPRGTRASADPVRSGGAGSSSEAPAC